MVLCFRLHFAKDAIIGNTAGATVRQLVSLVFERVSNEDSASSEESTPTKDGESSSGTEDETKSAVLSPKSLKPFALDAFMLFQVQLAPFYKSISVPMIFLSNREILSVTLIFNFSSKIFIQISTK